MNTPPPDLDEREIVQALAGGWGVTAASIAYLPLGFGSHHWVAVDDDGKRRFLTVDELDRKAWCGPDADRAFAGLRTAFETALALRDEAGLAFVQPPVRTLDGAVLRRLGPRHSMAVFPWIDDLRGGFGGAIRPEDREPLTDLLAALHRATPVVAARAPRRALDLPERAALEAAMRELDRPWESGPFGEAARNALAAGGETVRAWLGELDRLAQVAASARQPLVITHGEPHGGNVLRAGGHLVMIDWDTVALGPRERDLWMLDDGSPDALTAYTAATGTAPDAAALAFFRLAWTVRDAAEYVALFRSTHERNADTQKAWSGLASALGR